jgi:hypothetical protein
VSTIRVKCQMAATKAPKHVGVYSFRHTEFRSSFGTVYKASAGFEPSLEMAREPVPKVPFFCTRAYSRE